MAATSALGVLAAGEAEAVEVVGQFYRKEQRLEHQIRFFDGSTAVCTVNAVTELRTVFADSFDGAGELVVSGGPRCAGSTAEVVLTYVDTAGRTGRVVGEGIDDASVRTFEDVAGGFRAAYRVRFPCGDPSCELTFSVAPK